jgi:hypothetical protein
LEQGVPARVGAAPKPETRDLKRPAPNGRLRPKACFTLETTTFEKIANLKKSLRIDELPGGTPRRGPNYIILVCVLLLNFAPKDLLLFSFRDVSFPP